MSERRALANRKNALKSTGPKTASGKARASLNALKHGLRAVSLAVPYLEAPEDWEAHRLQVVRDLAPSGYLETVLSERAAALLWRLGRVVRYESEAVSISIVKKEEKADGYTSEVSLLDLQKTLEQEEENGKIVPRVRKLKGTAHVPAGDAAFVLDIATTAFHVDPEDEEQWSSMKDPEGYPSELAWEEFEGWTKNMVDEALRNVQAVGAEYLRDVEDLWAFVLSHSDVKKDTARKAYEEKAVKVDRKRREALLLDEKSLDRVSRYEAHLERALFRTLHELQRLQASRAGLALPPPAAVDLDVNVHQEAS